MGVTRETGVIWQAYVAYSTGTVAVDTGRHMALSEYESRVSLSVRNRPFVGEFGKPIGASRWARLNGLLDEPFPDAKNGNLISAFPVIACSVLLYPGACEATTTLAVAIDVPALRGPSYVWKRHYSADRS